MPTNTDFRKVLTDPTPLYFAAGVIEKLRTEAPERIAKLRDTDTKAMQTRVQEVLASLDSDVRKWREQAQTFALQGVGYAAEAAVKAKEGYDALAEQGKVVVEGWRGRADGEDGTGGFGYEATVEREPVNVDEPADEEARGAAANTEAAKAEEAKTGKAEPSGSAATSETASTAASERKASGAKGSAAKGTAKSATAKPAGGATKGSADAKPSGPRRNTPPSAS
ncbi:hypothetical protein WDH52_14850 [Streptomyces sp. TRM70308]|uniref:hypothetical protein n=1 Tax=Streptomyces sp. TRM70308 TaxID=3131932 RepID=UPI003D0189C4